MVRKSHSASLSCQQSICRQQDHRQSRRCATSNSQTRTTRDDQIPIGRPRQHHEPPRGFLPPALSDAPDTCHPDTSLGPCRQVSGASDNPQRTRPFAMDRPIVRVQRANGELSTSFRQGSLPPTRSVDRRHWHRAAGRRVVRAASVSAPPNFERARRRRAIDARKRPRRRPRPAACAGRTCNTRSRVVGRKRGNRGARCGRRALAAVG